jgi:tRNA nucleotidyltransferase (CCA-adding enzyme)
VKDLAVNGQDMMALGLKGKDIGAMLEKLLQMVLEEQLPNEKTALLQAAKKEI